MFSLNGPSSFWGGVCWGENEFLGCDTDLSFFSHFHRPLIPPPRKKEPTLKKCRGEFFSSDDQTEATRPLIIKIFVAVGAVGDENEVGGRVFLLWRFFLTKRWILIAISPIVQWAFKILYFFLACAWDFGFCVTFPRR